VKPETRQTFAIDLVPAVEPAPLAGLHALFGSHEAAVTVLPGTATAAWETALGNTLSPGERVLVVRNGPWGVKWAALCTLMGLEVEILDVPNGQPAPVHEIARRLGRDLTDAVRAVLVTHVETATGAVSDIAAVRRAIDESFHEALLMVDCTASLGAMPVGMDALAVDVAVAASRNGLAALPGVAVVALSAKACAAAAAATGPRSVADLRATAPGSVAVPHDLPEALTDALRSGLDMALTEGPDRAAARHRRLAEGVRRAVAAWGLDTVAEPGATADTVTAVQVPRHVDAREVIRIARERFRCTLGSGAGALSGRAFRLFHAGATDEGSVLAALAATEMALAEAGVRLTFGEGLGAAQAFWAEGRAVPRRLRIAAE
jgi:alanine-glyoxylate transaminase/serine-glyoxylate transaminase/serine-pyruvate transaminase